MHNSAQLRCFENSNDDFGVEAFWIGDAARVGYFVPLNGPLNGHPPSSVFMLAAALQLEALLCCSFLLPDLGFNCGPLAVFDDSLSCFESKVSSLC